MPTSALTHYPQVTWPTLEALYQLGLNVCEEIENFQPDVVLGLAHSGWLPVVVAPNSPAVSKVRMSRNSEAFGRLRERDVILD